MIVVVAIAAMHLGTAGVQTGCPIYFSDHREALRQLDLRRSAGHDRNAAQFSPKPFYHCTICLDPLRIWASICHKEGRLT
jgi:hypothetical protein